MLSDIVPRCLCLGHSSILKSSGKSQGRPDISGLGALVAARQQDDHPAAAASVVDAVPGAVADPQFRDSLPDRSNIPGIPPGKPLDPCKDSGPPSRILEPVEPPSEDLGLANLDHGVV
jgi:hypothetical protein